MCSNIYDDVTNFDVNHHQTETHFIFNSFVSMSRPTIILKIFEAKASFHAK